MGTVSLTRVKLFTDGACRGNPGPGGWAYLLEFAERSAERFGAASQTTNNRMELQAAIEGLRALAEPAHVEVWSDSRYVIDGMKSWLANWKRRGWKTADRQPVKNEDLWRALDNEAGRHHVTWHWVRGHSDHPQNERCDRLANQAIDEMNAARRA